VAARLPTAAHDTAAARSLRLHSIVAVALKELSYVRLIDGALLCPPEGKSSRNRGDA
jgi:hypothetical protein